MKEQNPETMYEEALEMAKSENVNLCDVERLLRKAARLGSGNANYALGTWYFFGKHFDRSIKKAVRLWVIAASLGSIDACLELAKLYERGDLVKRNNSKALSNYVMAMSLGSGQAHYEVARSFLYGLFTPKSKITYDKLRDRADLLGYEERPASQEDDD